MHFLKFEILERNLMILLEAVPHDMHDRLTSN